MLAGGEPGCAVQAALASGRWRATVGESYSSSSVSTALESVDKRLQRTSVRAARVRV